MQQPRRRPIFPKGCPLSIFGAGELNFRVRDGNGCGLSAGVTGIVCIWTMTACGRVTITRDAGASRRITIAYVGDPISRHADPWSGAGIEVKPSTISTAQLHPSPDFHMPPIKQMVSLRSYPVNPVGNLILRRASHLDAFSAYPNRTWLPSDAPGGTTGTPAVRPLRSSRTRSSSSQVPCAHAG
jgi:hypothetical protein